MADRRMDKDYYRKHRPGLGTGLAEGAAGAIEKRKAKNKKVYCASKGKEYDPITGKCV